MPLSSVSSAQLLTVPSQSGFARTTPFLKQSSLRQRSHSQSSFLFHQGSIFEKAKKPYVPALKPNRVMSSHVSSHVQSSRKPSLAFLSLAQEKYEKLKIRQQQSQIEHFQPKVKRKKSEKFLEIFHEMEGTDKGRSLVSRNYDGQGINLEEELKRKIANELKIKFEYEFAQKTKELTEELKRSENLRKVQQKRVQVEFAWTQTDPPPVLNDLSLKAPPTINTVPQPKADVKQSRQKSMEKNEKKIELEKTVIPPPQPTKRPMETVQGNVKSPANQVKTKVPRQNEDDGLEVINLVDTNKQTEPSNRQSSKPLDKKQEVSKKEGRGGNTPAPVGNEKRQEALEKIAGVINNCNLLLQIGETAAFCAQKLKKRRTDWRNSVILLYRYCYDSLKSFEPAHCEAYQQQALSKEELNHFINQNKAIREMLAKILKAFDKKNRLNQAYRSYIVSDDNTSNAIFPILLGEVDVFLKSMVQEKEDSDQEVVTCALRVVNSMLIIFKLIKPEVEILKDVRDLSEAEATRIFPVWKQIYLEEMRNTRLWK